MPPAESPSLPSTVKDRLLRAVSSRLTKDGELLVTSQLTRDQSRNVDDCLDKVRALVLAAARPPRPLRPSRPTLGSKVRRVEAKIRRTIGRTYRALSNYSAARPHLERAWALYRNALGEEDLNSLYVLREPL